MDTTLTEPAPGRREARKLDRRQAIVDAARRSFLEDGYAATSMSGLLKTLGGSKATLWSYFRSKEELFAAVIEDIASVFHRELESGLLESADIKETLVAFYSGFMRKTALPDSVAAWRLLVAESGRFPELGQIFYEKAAQRIERSLADYIESQIGKGRLRDEGPEKMAQFLLALCATQQNQRLWGVAAADAEEVDADAARFTDYFLRVFSTSG